MGTSMDMDMGMDIIRGSLMGVGIMWKTSVFKVQGARFRVQGEF